MYFAVGGVDTTSFRNVKPTTPNALGQCMCIGHFPVSYCDALSQNSCQS